MSDFLYNTDPDFLRNHLKSSLPKTDLQFEEKLKSAALQGEAARRDWDRNFSHRMSYDEYHYIGMLSAELVMGMICEDRAMDLLKAYRKASADQST
jgi:hypothetical protein